MADIMGVGACRLRQGEGQGQGQGQGRRWSRHDVKRRRDG